MFENPEKDDWYTFKKQFTALPGALGWTHRQARAALFNCLRGPAAAAASNSPIWEVTDVPLNAVDHNPDGETPWRDALLHLEGLFLPRAASQIAKSHFDIAAQQPRESLIAWHTRIRNLFLKAYPGNADEAALIRRFAAGLRSEQIRRQVFRSDPDTYLIALAAAQNELAVVEMDHALTGHKGEPMEIGAVGKRRNGGGFRIAAVNDLAEGNEDQNDDDGINNLSLEDDEDVNDEHLQAEYEGYLAVLDHKGVIAAADKQRKCFGCESTKHLFRDCHTNKKAMKGFGASRKNKGNKKNPPRRPDGKFTSRKNKNVRIFNRMVAMIAAANVDDDDSDQVAHLAATEQDHEKDF